ncbi:hypothetical protein Bca4012_060175 [Brassica carinata]
MARAGNKIINAKLVLLGDVGAGKSSLVLRFVKDEFVEFQESTIGAAFFSHTLAVNDAAVKFEIWDTAGQERYYSVAPMYYRGAAAAIIVFDITNQASFERAKKWVHELQSQGGRDIRTRESSFLHGNLSQDCNKCQRLFLWNCKEATTCNRKPNRNGSPKRTSGYGSEFILLRLREITFLLLLTLSLYILA